MVDFTSSNHINVLSHVIFVMVVFDHPFGDGLHVTDISENRQSNLLSLEDASVCNFDSSLQGH